MPCRAATEAAVQGGDDAVQLGEGAVHGGNDAVLGVAVHAGMRGCRAGKQRGWWAARSPCRQGEVEGI
jgi:hypothetical protein